MAQPNDSSGTKPSPEVTADGLRRIPRRTARTAEQPDAKRHCPDSAGDVGGDEALGDAAQTTSAMSYTVDVYNVPVHYTHGDLEELLEASGIEAPWFESAQFLPPLAHDPEFCAALLRYSDAQAAQVTTRHLDGQDVASEAGTARQLTVKFNKAQVSLDVSEDQLQRHVGLHLTDTASDNGDAPHDGTTEVESVPPHVLEEFCERWGFKQLTRDWIASLSVEVQRGIIDEYNPGAECSEGGHEDASSFLLTGLPADADENIVKALLFVYGEAKTCRMEPVGASSATAIVVMESAEDASAAVEGLDGMTLDGSETPLAASLQDADTKRRDEDRGRLAALESLAELLQAKERHSALGLLDRLARAEASETVEAPSPAGARKRRRRRAETAAARAESTQFMDPAGTKRIPGPAARQPRVIEPPPTAHQPRVVLPPSMPHQPRVIEPQSPSDPNGHRWRPPQAQPLHHALHPLPVRQVPLPHPLPPPLGWGVPPPGWGAPPPGWGPPPLPGRGVPPLSGSVPGRVLPPPGFGYPPGFGPPPLGSAQPPSAYPELGFGPIGRSAAPAGKPKPPSHPPPVHLRR